MVRQLVLCKIFSSTVHSFWEHDPLNNAILPNLFHIVITKLQHWIVMKEVAPCVFCVIFFLEFLTLISFNKTCVNFGLKVNCGNVGTCPAAFLTIHLWFTYFTFLVLRNQTPMLAVSWQLLLTLIWPWDSL